MPSSTTSAADSTLSLDDVLDLIRDGVAQAGNQKNYAQFAHVAEAHLSNVLHGRQKPSKKLRAYLNLERVTVYRRLTTDY